MFELAQALWDYKTSDLNCSYEADIQKAALTISIMMISFRKILTAVMWYWLTREEHSCMGDNLPLSLFSHIVNIYSQYILKTYYRRRGNSPDLKHFVVCF